MSYQIYYSICDRPREYRSSSILYSSWGHFRFNWNLISLMEHPWKISKLHFRNSRCPSQDAVSVFKNPVLWTLAQDYTCNPNTWVWSQPAGIKTFSWPQTVSAGSSLAMYNTTAFSQSQEQSVPCWPADTRSQSHSAGLREARGWAYKSVIFSWGKGKSQKEKKQNTQILPTQLAASPQVWRYRIASQQFSQKNNWPKRQSASHGLEHTHSELLCAENLRSSQWGSLTNTPLARKGGQQEWKQWERPFSAVVSHLKFYRPSLRRLSGKTQLISIVKTQQQSRSPEQGRRPGGDS